MKIRDQWSTQFHYLLLPPLEEGQYPSSELNLHLKPMLCAMFCWFTEKLKMKMEHEFSSFNWLIKSWLRWITLISLIPSIYKLLPSGQVLLKVSFIFSMLQLWNFQIANNKNAFICQKFYNSFQAFWWNLFEKLDIHMYVGFSSKYWNQISPCLWCLSFFYWNMK